MLTYLPKYLLHHVRINKCIYSLSTSIPFHDVCINVSCKVIGYISTLFLGLYKEYVFSCKMLLSSIFLWNIIKIRNHIFFSSNNIELINVFTFKELWTKIDNSHRMFLWLFSRFVVIRLRRRIFLAGWERSALIFVRSSGFLVHSFCSD